MFANIPYMDGIFQRVVNQDDPWDQGFGACGSRKTNHLFIVSGMTPCLVSQASSNFLQTYKLILQTLGEVWCFVVRLRFTPQEDLTTGTWKMDGLVWFRWFSFSIGCILRFQPLIFRVILIIAAQVHRAVVVLWWLPLYRRQIPSLWRVDVRTGGWSIWSCEIRFVGKRFVKTRSAGGRCAKRGLVVSEFFSTCSLTCSFLWSFVWEYMLLWLGKHSSIAMIRHATNGWEMNISKPVISTLWLSKHLVRSCECNRVNVLDPQADPVKALRGSKHLGTGKILEDFGTRYIIELMDMSPAFLHFKYSQL